MDGLVVKIHGYSTAALSRKQLEWWSEGYTFPNSAWRDDARDLSLSLCTLASEKVAGFATFAQGAMVDLCRRMRDGRYTRNLLRALQHPLFSGWASADDGVAAGYAGLPHLEHYASTDRRIYTYAPVLFMDGSGIWLDDGDDDDNDDDNGSGNNVDTATSSLSSNTTANSAPWKDVFARIQYHDGIRGEQAAERHLPGSLPQVESNATSDAEGGGNSYDSMALLPGSADILRLLAPLKPWIVQRDGTGVLIQWKQRDFANIDLNDVPLSKFATARFNLAVNGVSVFSGPEDSFRLDLTDPRMRSACLRVRVAAFHLVLGWSPESPLLEINDCNV